MRNVRVTVIPLECTRCGEWHSEETLTRHRGACPVKGGEAYPDSCGRPLIDREHLAGVANTRARYSRVPGAPVLSGASGREMIARWLQWNDPNGCHLDELSEDPYTYESAWDALAAMIEGDS
jgi:hypothetical protein